MITPNESNNECEPETISAVDVLGSEVVEKGSEVGQSVLGFALLLINIGVPVFVAKSNPAFKPGGEQVEFFHPTGWQETPVDPVTLKNYSPGDALCAVMGHALDAVDVDTKNGAVAEVEAERLRVLGVSILGEQVTPSGGAHFLIPATGIHSAACKKTGVDFRGGGADGSGRGFIYIAGTERPKYAWQGYQLVKAPTLADLEPFQGARAANAASTATYLKAVGIKPRTEPADRSELVEGEPVEEVPDWLQTELATSVPVGERSEKFHALIGKMHREGFSQGQIVTLISPWCVESDKFTGRVEQEVTRSLEGIKQDALKETTYLGERDEYQGLSGITGDTEEELSTWSPVELEPFLDGSHKPLKPTIFERTDGQALLYPGKIHSIYGESESGKSLIAQFICAAEIIQGNKVLYIDFEDSPAEVTKRLQLFGATPQAISEHFTYLHPSQSLKDPHNREALARVLKTVWTLAVIDGFTVAMTLITPASGTPEAQVAEFMSTLPKRIVKKTNAAVLTIDHVVKSKDARGRFALGSQEKLNQVTGAAYLLEVSQAVCPGARGLLVLRVTKDRVGQVRSNSGTWRASDRTQEAARITIDGTDPDWINVIVEPPTNSTGPFRPTHIMQLISEYLETCPEPVTGKEIKENTKGKGETQVTALQALVSEGYVERVSGARGANLHRSLKPYQESLDSGEKK
jgi:hypothetical protein